MHVPGLCLQSWRSVAPSVPGSSSRHPSCCPPAKGQGYAFLRNTQFVRFSSYLRHLRRSPCRCTKRSGGGICGRTMLCEYPSCWGGFPVGAAKYLACYEDEVEMRAERSTPLVVAIGFRFKHLYARAKACGTCRTQIWPWNVSQGASGNNTASTQLQAD